LIFDVMNAPGTQRGTTIMTTIARLLRVTRTSAEREGESG
jgi:hypothetical protein